MQRAVILGVLVVVAVLAVGWAVLAPAGPGVGVPLDGAEGTADADAGPSPLIAERGDAEAACVDVLAVVKRRWSADKLDEMAKVLFDDRAMSPEAVKKLCVDASTLPEDALLAEITRVTGVGGGGS